MYAKNAAVLNAGDRVLLYDSFAGFFDRLRERVRCRRYFLLTYTKTRTQTGERSGPRERGTHSEQSLSGFEWNFFLHEFEDTFFPLTDSTVAASATVQQQSRGINAQIWAGWCRDEG